MRNYIEEIREEFSTELGEAISVLKKVYRSSHIVFRGELNKKKLQLWKVQNLGFEPIVKQNGTLMTDQEIQNRHLEVENGKFGGEIKANSGEAYESYCERVLNAYLGNLGNLKKPEFYGISQDSSEKAKNLSFIQYLCHMYAYGLERLHLQGKDPISYSDVNQLIDLMLLRLGEIFKETNPNLKNPSMILELCMSLLLEVCHHPGFECTQLLTSNFCQFLEVALFNKKFYSKSLFSEFLQFLNCLFMGELFTKYKIIQPRFSVNTRNEADQIVTTDQVQLEVNYNCHFIQIQAICLKFILSKVTKFSRTKDWYLNSLFQEMSPEEIEEYFEEFLEGPYFNLNEQFDLEYFQMIQNLAHFYDWFPKTQIILDISNFKISKQKYRTGGLFGAARRNATARDTSGPKFSQLPLINVLEKEKIEIDEAHIDKLIDMATKLSENRSMQLFGNNPQLKRVNPLYVHFLMILKHNKFRSMTYEDQADYISSLYNNADELKLLDLSKVKPEALLKLFEEDNLQYKRLTSTKYQKENPICKMLSSKQYYEKFVKIILSKIQDPFFDMNVFELQFFDFYRFLKSILDSKTLEKCSDINLSKLKEEDFRKYDVSMYKYFSKSSLSILPNFGLFSTTDITDDFQPVDISPIGTEYSLDLIQFKNEKEKNSEEIGTMAEEEIELHQDFRPEIVENEENNNAPPNGAGFGGNLFRPNPAILQNVRTPKFKDINLVKDNFSSYSIQNMDKRKFRIMNMKDFLKVDTHHYLHNFGKIKFARLNLCKRAEGNKVSVQFTKEYIQTDMDPSNLTKIRRGNILLLPARKKTQNSSFGKKNYDKTVTFLGPAYSIFGARYSNNKIGRKIIIQKYNEKERKQNGEAGDLLRFQRGLFDTSEVHAVIDQRSKKKLLNFKTIKDKKKLRELIGDGRNNLEEGMVEKYIKLVNPMRTFLPTK